MKIGFGFEELRKEGNNYPVYAGVQIESINFAGGKACELLIPALIDAILGAAGEGGKNDLPGKKGEPSDIFDIELLQETERYIHYSGWKLINADIVLGFPESCHNPPDRNLISARISKALFINPEQANIKCNMIRGRKKMYSCHTVVLLGTRDR